MDFIEDNIISNGFIPDNLKLNLLNSDEMLPYAFVGAFLHISSNYETEDEENL
jgi:hypothetical protein